MINRMNFKPVDVIVLEQLSENGAHEDRDNWTVTWKLSSFKSGFWTQTAVTLLEVRKGCTGYKAR